MKYNFWRTYGGAEVDWIEKIENKPNSEVEAFEFKLGSKSVSKGAKNFEEEYKTKVNLINRDNFTDYLLWFFQKIFLNPQKQNSSMLFSTKH